MKPRLLTVGVLARRTMLQTTWACLALLTWPALATGGEEAPPPEEKLPSGKEVIERSIEATGGRQAIKRIANRVAEGTMEIKGLGIRGKLTSYGARPNRTYTLVDLEGLGPIEQGISMVEGVADGRVVWELNPMTGPRIKKGKEKEALLLLSYFDPTEFESLYGKMECVGIEEVDGEPCYRVDCYPKDADDEADDKPKEAQEPKPAEKDAEGDEGEDAADCTLPITAYYSQETGLPVKVALTFPHQMGEMKVENLIGDYKEVDGIMLPHRTVEKVLTLETEVIITSYRHNADLPGDRFALPKKIQVLVDLEKAEAAAKALENAEAAPEEKPESEAHEKPAPEQKKPDQGGSQTDG